MEDAVPVKKWFYAENRERKGPVTEETMSDLIEKGEILPANLVWREGFADWKVVSETELNIYIEKKVIQSADKDVPPPISDKSIPPIPGEPGQKDTASMKKWFYEEKGEKKGPVSEKEIGKLIHSGTLSPDCQVWKEGFAKWENVSETELSAYINKTLPPPISGERVNNNFVWVVAFAPIIGLILTEIAIGMFNVRANHIDTCFNIIVIAINVTFCILDERELKKAGHDTSKFQKWWMFLIPVYLYKRAKRLNQGLAYFIVWIVCFSLMLLASMAE